MTKAPAAMVPEAAVPSPLLMPLMTLLGFCVERLKLGKLSCCFPPGVVDDDDEDDEDEDDEDDPIPGDAILQINDANPVASHLKALTWRNLVEFGGLTQ